MVASAIVSNASVPPELVDSKCHKDNVRIVELVIVANPAANEAPCSFDGRISAETGLFLWLAT